MLAWGVQRRARKMSLIVDLGAPNSLASREGAQVSSCLQHMLWEKRQSGVGYWFRGWWTVKIKVELMEGGVGLAVLTPCLAEVSRSGKRQKILIGTMWKGWSNAIHAQC